VAVLSTLVACGGGGDDDAEPSTTTTVAAEATTTTEPLQFSGDEASPFCGLLRDVDPDTLLAGDPGDPASVETGFRRLVGVLRELQAAAPPEVAADTSAVADGIAALDAALAEVGYDFDALAASGAGDEVTAAVNDPAFAAAGDRLSAYRSQVCHL
jgi:hypothetical protein